MSDFQEILDRVVLGNSIGDYLIAVSTLLAAMLFNAFIAHRISNMLFKLMTKGTPNLDKEALYALISKPLRYIILLIVLFICTSHLEYPESWDIAPKSEFGLSLILHKTYLSFLILLSLGQD